MNDGTPNPPRVAADPKRSRAAVATRLLGWTLQRRGALVARIVERLEAPDGAAWLASVLACAPLPGADTARFLLVDGRASVQQLRNWKDDYKRLHVRGGASELMGALGYYLTQAAALAHHGVRISSLPADQIEDALVELASALPLPWSTLCERAVARAHG